jgi:hypothetical protein
MALTRDTGPVNQHGSGYIIDHLKKIFQSGLDIKVLAPILEYTAIFFIVFCEDRRMVR